ncbi:MAG: hypothetical protein ACD_79C00577G0002 [uncultured bacterium]|nr:MAG: hypothetical protein ACD_79C00577G0002 [uncultured bacterium]
MIEGTKDYYDLRDSDSLLIGNNGNKFALLSRFSRNPYPHLIDGKIPEGGIINDLLRKEFFETLIPYNNENITLNEAIQKILQSKGNLRGKGQKITQILSEINLNNHPLKEKIENIFLKKWAKNKATLLAVRSNAILIDGTIEDSQGTAGLFKTVLSVNKDNLFENVVEVWKSLYSHRALEFYDSIRKDLPLEQFVLKIGMPCMLLEQVNAEVSVFVSSVMPESFEEEKVIMTASLYQGEGIAQGNIPVDTFIIDKNGHVISDIREKNEAMYGDNESVGLRKIEVIPFLIRKALKKINEKLMPFIDRTELKERFKKQIKEPALTYEEIKKIAYIAKLIQNELGYPVQMELSLDENREINIFQIKIDHTIGVKEGQEYLRELMIDSLINEFKNSLVKLQKTKTFYEIVSEFSKILELWMKDIGNENIFNDEKTLNILMNEILDSEIIKGTPFAYQINRNSNEFRKAA